MREYTWTLRRYLLTCFFSLNALAAFQWRPNCLLPRRPLVSLQNYPTVLKYRYLKLSLARSASKIPDIGVRFIVYDPEFHSISCATIKVQEGWTYKGSFYAKSDSFTNTIIASLKSSRGTVFATKSITGITKTWKKFTFEFQPNYSAPTDGNVLNVAVDGDTAAGKTIYFGLFSLFPPTSRGRENGMRIDLVEALAATQPSVWRFVEITWKVWGLTHGESGTRPSDRKSWLL